MPWSTPTLKDVRTQVRDNIQAFLPGSDASVPNSVLRVMSDVQGGLCHLTLQYIDWLSLQLLPDTAETVWLDRHGQIWLVNADGTIGRKQATLAEGVILVTGTLVGAVIPQATLLQAPSGVQYETTGEAYVGNEPTPVPARAVDPGSISNMDPGTAMSFGATPPGVDNVAIVQTMTGGTDEETDDELRMRILQRIREPPMGGSQSDYVRWALAVPGVTRAWCAPNEMGIGTVTVRFLMDDLRAANDGWPYPDDVEAVAAYLDTVRPVAIKDFFVEAPIQYPIDFDIANLNPNTPEVQAQIEASIQNMLYVYASPGQTIYAAWKSFAIMNAPGVISFQLTNTTDDVMPAPGYMALLGNIYYEP